MFLLWPGKSALAAFEFSFILVLMNCNGCLWIFDHLVDSALVPTIGYLLFDVDIVINRTLRDLWLFVKLIIT